MYKTSIMLSKKRTCVVPGCTDKDSVRHRFPKRSEDTDVFKIWMDRVNQPKLHSLTKEKIYKTYVVCDRHFAAECKVEGWVKLRRKSVPTLFLPNIYRAADIDKITKIDPQSEELAGESHTVSSQIVSSQNRIDSSDLQLVNSQDILLNLDSFTLHMIDAQDTLETIYKISNKHEQESSSHELSHELENQEMIAETEESDVLQSEVQPVPRSIYLTNQEIESSISGKPYFKSVKSYLLDSHSITEICRICFRSIINESMIKLFENSPYEDVNKMKNMLKLVLPDLDLEMYPNSVVCTRCTELLVYSYELKETWLTTEAKLQKIIEKKKGITKHDADLVILAKPIIKDDNKDLSDAKKKDNSVLSNNTDKGKQATITKKIMKNILHCNKNISKVEVFHGDFDQKSQQIYKPKSQLRFSKRVWGLGPYVCETCGDIWTALKPFKKHLKKHAIMNKDTQEQKAQQQKQPVMCELCGNFFSDTGKLKMHFQKHTKIEHKCKICNKIFKYDRVLQLHIRQYHLKLYNYIQCHLCGKQLADKASLRMHLMTHNAKKLFSCKICNKNFNMLSKLKMHVRRHSNNKLECEYCGRSIKYEYALRKHIKIYHMNEGEYICDFCSRPYWKKVDLIKHKIRIHGWRQEPKTDPGTNSNN